MREALIINITADSLFSDEGVGPRSKATTLSPTVASDRFMFSGAKPRSCSHPLFHTLFKCYLHYTPHELILQTYNLTIITIAPYIRSIYYPRPGARYDFASFAQQDHLQMTLTAFLPQTAKPRSPAPSPSSHSRASRPPLQRLRTLGKDSYQSRLAIPISRKYGAGCRPP